jgi:hypothetical protein
MYIMYILTLVEGIELEGSFLYITEDKANKGSRGLIPLLDGRDGFMVGVVEYQGESCKTVVYSHPCLHEGLECTFARVGCVDLNLLKVLSIFLEAEIVYGVRAGLPEGGKLLEARPLLEVLKSISRGNPLMEMIESLCWNKLFVEG